MSTITLMQKLQRAYLTLFNLIIPHRCVLCNSLNCDEIDLCNLCLNIMPWLKSACPVCANPMPEEYTKTLCGHCMRIKPHYEKTLALFHYKKPASFLIRHLKFNQKLTYAHLLGFLLAKKLKAEYEDNVPDILIPIPLHKIRLKQRGYNQALEISRVISKQLKIPLIKNGLIRKRHTKAQSEVAAKERQKNVRNAFSCTIDVTGKSILLIDDVITTGFTVNEASKVLIKAGAKTVHVCCLGRTSQNR